jgi:tetratricopeptide (TPR) repeat protein
MHEGVGKKHMTPYRFGAGLQPCTTIGRFARRAAFTLAVLLLGVAGASAQTIDRVDIRRAADGQAEIVIRMLPTVLYLRHAPLTASSTLRIYFRTTGNASAQAALPRETWSSPPSDLVPHFDITYPEPDGAMAIRFASDVVAKVRQGSDNNELSILLPALPGAVNGAKEPLPVGPGEAPPRFYKSVEPKIPNLPDQGLPAVAADAPVVAAAASAESPAAATAPASTEAAAAPAFAPVPLDKVEEVSRDLLAKAKASLDKNDTASAIEALNNLLNLPASSSSPGAQELIGLAREKSGDFAKARAEYDLFLRLYPNDPGVPRVKDRLAKVPDVTAPSPVAGGAQGIRRMEPSGWKVTGGVSQNFYTGNSHIVTLTAPPPGFLDFTTQSLNQTDQRALVTSIDLNAYRRSETTEHRFVFRDNYTANFLNNQNDTESLGTAYYEINNRALGYQARIGRQSGNFGLLGQFDGIAGGYQWRPDVRINAAFGEPTLYSNRLTPIWHLLDAVSSQHPLSPITNASTNRRTFGADIEYLGKPESLGGSLYFAETTADGYTDRQAIGLELRYFDSKRSVYSMLDYDVAIKGLNIAMVQGNLTTDSGNSYYALFDHRRAPMLQLSNVLSYATPSATSGLPQTPANSIAEALLNQGLSLSDLRQWAIDTAAWSNVFSGGLTRPLSPKWQLGADVTVSQMSSSPGVIDADGVLVGNQASQSPTKSLSVNLIGNGIFLANDTLVGNGNVVKAPTYHGLNLSANHVSVWKEVWRVDAALRWYRQTDNLETKMTRISPTFRVNYRFRTNLSFDAEVGLEKSKQTSADGSTTDSNRKYLYLGYRWDLL